MYRGERGELATLTLMLPQERSSWGLMLGYIHRSFSELKRSAPSSLGVFEGENKFLTRVQLYCMEERMEEHKKLLFSVLL